MNTSSPQSSGVPGEEHGTVLADHATHLIRKRNQKSENVTKTQDKRKLYQTDISDTHQNSETIFGE